MRRALPAIAAVLLTAGCGGARPMPSLEDYSLGVSAAVEELREEFFERNRGRVDPVETATAAPLGEVGERWRRACSSRCGSAVRIIDLQKKSSSEVTVRVEFRLQCWAREDSAERVGTVAIFDLSLVSNGGWQLRSARAVNGPAVIQRALPHLSE